MRLITRERHLGPFIVIVASLSRVDSGATEADDIIRLSELLLTRISEHIGRCVHFEISELMLFSIMS